MDRLKKFMKPKAKPPQKKSLLSILKNKPQPIKLECIIEKQVEDNNTIDLQHIESNKIIVNKEILLL